MSEDSFLREVEEELRSDKLKAFWRRFAPFIIGAAVLIVLIVAANEVYKWWRDSTAAAASDQYYAAVDLVEAGDMEAAGAALAEIAQDGPAGYSILARFQQANVLADQDPEAAIAAYDELASSLDQQRLRELAYVLAGYLAVDHLDAAAVDARVGALTGEESPLRNSAREALGLAHYKQGNIEDARALFEEIAADPAAAQDMQLRAFVYLEQMASTGVEVSQDLLDSAGPDDDAQPTDPEAADAPVQPVAE